MKQETKRDGERLWNRSRKNTEARAWYLKSLYDKANVALPQKRFYIDVGSNEGIDASIFGQEFRNVVCLDKDRVLVGKCKRNVPTHHYIASVVGDAQFLPFKSHSFDMVTAFSLIEHIPNQVQVLREFFRVVGKTGTVVLQFPNRYFFLDLHVSGNVRGMKSFAPNLYYLPRKIRRLLQTKFLKVSWVAEINVPKVKEIIKWVRQLDPEINVTYIRVIFPISIIPATFRIFYVLLLKIKLLNIVPVGYMLICRRV